MIMDRLLKQDIAIFFVAFGLFLSSFWLNSRGTNAASSYFTTSVAVLIICIVFYFFIVSVHVNGFLNAEKPQLKHYFIALATSYLYLVLIFGNLYVAVHSLGHKFANITQCDYWGMVGDFMFYSIVTATTLGYGNIHPVDGIPKFFSALEVTLGPLFFITILTIAFQQRSTGKYDPGVPYRPAKYTP